MRILIALLIAVAISLPVAAESRFEEGVNYVTLNTPEQKSEKIQVVEFFGYFCPHCNTFEPHLENWLKNKPADVEFVQVPATFNRDSIRMQAKTFYALQQMELIDKMHPVLFDAVHAKKIRLNTQQEMEKFLQTQGVDIPTFRTAMDSFVVSLKLQQAIRLAERYAISGVPAVVVDGRYRVEQAANWDEKLEITDYLIEQARATRPAVTEASAAADAMPAKN